MRLILCAVLLVGASVSPSLAEIEIQEARSPDGQVFWLVEEPSIPIVAIEMSFKAGSWMDPAGKEGLARFTMSLLHEGAGDLDTVAFSNRADEISARFGFGAGRDSSTVSARLLVETLDESVDLMALAMTRPRFDPEPIELTRRQILSGIAQSETDPSSIARKAWAAEAYPDHPYGRPSSGTRESIASITLEDLQAMHEALFARGGVHISIVGAIDAVRAGEVVDRLLSGLPDVTPPDVPRVETTPPPGLTVIEQDVPQSVALLGHGGLRRSDPDYIAAYVMNYILGGGGLTSRLTEEVREKRGLAYSVSSSLIERDGAEAVVVRVATANARIAESLDVIRTEWARMAAGGVTGEELEAAKTYLTGSFPLRFDSNAKIANFLVFMQTEELGRDYINRRNALIDAVTADDISRIAKRLLKPEAFSVVVVGKPEGL